MANGLSIRTAADVFHANLIELCQLVIDTVDWAKDEGVECKINSFHLIAAKAIISGWKPEDSITGFIEKSYMYWEKIRLRDEDFLSTNAKVLFAELPQESIEAFLDLFKLKDAKGSDIIPQDTRDSIWDFLKVMVECAIRHIHVTRKPV